MPTIAVTGATGFVGKFVAQYLEERGYKVFRFGRRNGSGAIAWDISRGTFGDHPNIDCVVHCAALVDDWASYEKSYSVNVLGTRNVLLSFLGASKFIYVSSASVYDAFCKNILISEHVCIGGRLLNNYSKTKLLGEKEVEKAAVPARVILRPHIVYGPGDKTVGPRIRNGIKFGYFPVVGNGKNRISFTHVENLAQAILQSIQSSQQGISAYNITDGEPVVFLDALQDVKKLNGLRFKEFFLPVRLCLVVGYVCEFLYKVCGAKKSPLLTRYIVDQMSSDHILDISAAVRELHYNPTKNLKNDFLLQ